jgi:hypothetical protein
MAVALGFVTARALIFEGYAEPGAANVARVPHQRVRASVGAADAAAAAPRGPGPEQAGPLFGATVIVGVEAAALTASALWLLAYQALGHRPHDPLDAWLVVALTAIFAIGLGLVWRGLYRRRRWARSPAVLTELLALPLGYNACGNGVWWVGVPLLGCGVLGLVALFAPSTTHALVDGG